MPPRLREMREEEVTSHPSTGKPDDLRSVEVLDEDDGGWAGHHEEVDYSKVHTSPSMCIDPVVIYCVVGSGVQ